MLLQLTRYLLQFQQVHVPTVGTIKVVQHPASLDVAAKLIHPPSFALHFTEDGWLTKHQLWYFGTQLQQDETATRDALQDTGLQVRKAIEHGSFTWNGIGTFTYRDHNIHFEPLAQDAALQPISAERVLRKGVQHAVRIGDQVVLSDGTTDAHAAREKHWTWRQIVGWSAVVLAIFFIVFYLYKHQFQSSATGLHERVELKPPPATYRQ